MEQELERDYQVYQEKINAMTSVKEVKELYSVIEKLPDSDIKDKLKIEFNARVKYLKQNPETNLYKEFKQEELQRLKDTFGIITPEILQMEIYIKDLKKGLDELKKLADKSDNPELEEHYNKVIQKIKQIRKRQKLVAEF